MRRWEIYRYEVAMRTRIYDSVEFRESLQRARFERHNAVVREEVPKDRLLVMNILEGDGWETLCPFLGPAPAGVEFPHVR